MSELSLGFLTLLGFETCAMAVLLWRADGAKQPTLQVTVHIFNVLLASSVLNGLYLVCWFLHVQTQELFK